MVFGDRLETSCISTADQNIVKLAGAGVTRNMETTLDGKWKSRKSLNIK